MWFGWAFGNGFKLTCAWTSDIAVLLLLLLIEILFHRRSSQEPREMGGKTPHKNPQLWGGLSNGGLQPCRHTQHCAFRMLWQLTGRIASWLLVWCSVEEQAVVLEQKSWWSLSDVNLKKERVFIWLEQLVGLPQAPKTTRKQTHAETSQGKCHWRNPLLKDSLVKTTAVSGACLHCSWEAIQKLVSPNDDEHQLRSCHDSFQSRTSCCTAILHSLELFRLNDC